MRSILFVLALAAAACSKKSENTASGGTSCAAAASAAVRSLAAGPAGGDIQAKLENILTTRCTEDKWPAATIDCYAKNDKGMAGMRACRETLPAEQQQKLTGEIRAAMMGAAGGAGPMHGAPSGGGMHGGSAPAGSAAPTP